MDREPGLLVAGKYRLESRLGGGGFGDVWLATQLTNRRRVAIKFLHSNSLDARQRFSIEVEALARLSHPHCVSVFDHGGERDGAPFLVTAYVEGPTLDKWLHSRPLMEDVIEVASQIADAIAHAHLHQIAHRDIKPPNVIIQQVQGQGPRAMLLDFGVAKLSSVRQTDVTKTGEIIGTPGFMSPEQLRAGRVGTPTDVYSFGVLLFEMISGAPPFAGGSQLELAMNHLASDAAPLRGAPSPDIADLVAAMLQKDAERRPTMAVVAKTLRGRDFQRPAAPTQLSRPRPAESSGRAASFPAFAALGAGFVALALIAVWLLVPKPVPEIVPARLRGGGGAALVRQPDVAHPSGDSASDAGAAAVDEGMGLAPGEGSPGCGLEPRYKEWTLQSADGTPIWVWVPPTYKRNRMAPVLLMLHDVLQPPEDLVRIPDLVDLASRDGVVIIAPGDNDVTDTWLSAPDIRKAIRSLDLVGAEVCLDMQQIYVIGHGNGGGGAHRVARELDGIRAMAHTAHRWGGDMGDRDKLRTEIPTMIVSMLDDPTNPIDGSPDCLGHVKWTLAEHEKVERRAHQCKGAYDPSGPICQDLACQSPLRLCRPRGGRDWETMRTRLVTNNPITCNSPAGKFPFADEIWAFFQRAAPFGP